MLFLNGVAASPAAQAAAIQRLSQHEHGSAGDYLAERRPAPGIFATNLSPEFAV
jgi:hypothetical protein